MPHLDVNSISYALPDGRPLLDRVSFRVGDGARVALIGPNGDYWAIYLREWGAANSSRAMLAAVALGLGIASVIVGVRAR